MTEEKAPVVFVPSGRRGEFELGTPLLTAARQLGVDIDSLCGGRGLCGRCQILCAQGEFPKLEMASSVANLNPITATEEKYSERKAALNDRRLGCHALIQGPLVIDVPPESQVHRQVVRKDIDEREVSLNSGIVLYFLEVAEATLADARGDLERVLFSLEAQWQVAVRSMHPALLPLLQRVLREADWQITVAVRDQEVVAVWPGFHDAAYGVAIDVGSTTIAGHVCDLQTGRVVASSGLMNPQIRFGEDLMSRVSYVMMNPGGDAELTEAIRAGLAEVVADLARTAEVPVEAILSFVLTGNPIMHHLVLGIDPTELGGAPFALAVDGAVTLPATAIGLPGHVAANAYFPPCVAGHVGADCAAAVLAQTPYAKEEITLLVDIGTNAEIVLGNDKKLLACSSPTGPAFEGAQISAGQRATSGAIERVRIDRDSGEVRIKVIGVAAWSDEPEFDQGVAATGINGICGSGIIEVVGEMLLAGIISADGLMRGELAGDNPRVRKAGEAFEYLLWRQGENEICVTQNDVRQIQLAKAALYAGIRLLMDAYPVQSVDRIEIAGAFGSNIDPQYALLLGLVPDCALENVKAVGNAASTGARIALLNLEARAEIESVVRGIEKIETATEPGFQEHFVAAMAIPHRDHAFTHLFSVVPEPPVVEVRGKRRRRRRS